MEYLAGSIYFAEVERTTCGTCLVLCVITSDGTLSLYSTLTHANRRVRISTSWLTLDLHLLSHTITPPLPNYAPGAYRDKARSISYSFPVTTDDAPLAAKPSPTSEEAAQKLDEANSVDEPTTTHLIQSIYQATLDPLVGFISKTARLSNRSMRFASQTLGSRPLRDLCPARRGL